MSRVCPPSPTPRQPGPPASPHRLSTAPKQAGPRAGVWSPPRRAEGRPRDTGQQTGLWGLRGYGCIRSGLGSSDEDQSWGALQSGATIPSPLQPGLGRPGMGPQGSVHLAPSPSTTCTSGGSTAAGLTRRTQGLGASLGENCQGLRRAPDGWLLVPTAHEAHTCLTSHSRPHAGRRGEPRSRQHHALEEARLLGN